LVECFKQRGALFLIATLIIQVECWTALTTSFHSLKAVLGTILCFEAWHDQPTCWEIGHATGETEKAEAVIALMMRLIVKFLPRL
jgi:hypothetical protein